MVTETYWPGDLWPGAEGPWAQLAEIGLLWSEKTGWAGRSLSLGGKNRSECISPRHLNAQQGPQSVSLRETVTELSLGRKHQSSQMLVDLGSHREDRVPTPVQEEAPSAHASRGCPTATVSMPPCGGPSWETGTPPQPTVLQPGLCPCASAPSLDFLQLRGHKESRWRSVTVCAALKGRVTACASLSHTPRVRQHCSEPGSTGLLPPHRPGQARGTRRLRGQNGQGGARAIPPRAAGTPAVPKDGGCAGKG